MLSIELLKAIAVLCQINIGSMSISMDKIKQEQESCHKYYSKCIDNKPENILMCIEKKN